MRLTKKKSAAAYLSESKKEQILKFISENMQLSGFSGKITPEIMKYEPDMKEIAESARHLGAQVPISQRLPGDK